MMEAKNLFDVAWKNIDNRKRSTQKTIMDGGGNKALPLREKSILD